MTVVTVVDGCGRLWTVVDGCGRLWTVVDGCDGCGCCGRIVDVVTFVGDCG